uniref:Uncharacterized protein n=1 Tax=Romanomermis culicivorax TaxID=13658 RepID=A0A915J5F1_ROMCU
SPHTPAAWARLLCPVESIATATVAANRAAVGSSVIDRHAIAPSRRKSTFPASIANVYMVLTPP